MLMHHPDRVSEFVHQDADAMFASSIAGEPAIRTGCGHMPRS
jgi:hypothetical protein